MIKLDPKIRTALLNTATDAAGHLSLGGVWMTAPVSMEAAALNLGRSGLCFATRLVTEFEKVSKPLPVPRFFRNFARNRGASLIVNGGLTYISAFMAAANVTGTSLRDYFVPAALGAFATGGTSIGIAASMRDHNPVKMPLDTFGVLMGCVGMAMAAGPATPLLVYGAYGLAAASALALAVKRRAAYGVLQPEGLLSAGCLTASFNAFVQGNPFLGLANLQFTTGFQFMDKLKKHGGVVEWFQSRRMTEKSSLPPSV